MGELSTEIGGKIEKLLLLHTIMAIKSGQSNYDPTPNNTSESPYRDSVEVDVTQSSVPPPSYGSIPNSNREDHRTFDAGQEESHYWNRLHKKTKLRKIFHFLLATLILGSLLYFLLSLGRHDKGTTHYAVSQFSLPTYPVLNPR